nr:uncharacterized protein LOC111413068 [Onthophagus taurus]
MNSKNEDEFRLGVKCGNENDPTLMECDLNTSIEAFELRLSPEQSAESESGETSQDNVNTDSDTSIDSQENVNINESWTKDEDKTILETLQKEGHREETFVKIAELLKSRSVDKIKERFQLLMRLIQEMANKKT